MIKYVTFIFMLLSISLTKHAQGQTSQQVDVNSDLIDRFLLDAKDRKIATDVLLSQYIRIEKELTDEYFEYLEASLDEVRLNIQMKQLDQIEKFKFRDLNRKETRDIDLEGKNPDQIYFLKIKDRLLVALFLKDDKIASFTLVSKGNHVAHFVTY